MLAKLKSDIQAEANPALAKTLQRFFKTGKGEYGEGDVFIGLKVPQSRSIAKKYAGLPFNQITKLLRSSVHEERLIALLILVQKFFKATEEDRKIIFDFYLKHTRYVNNWDLVDLSADKIVGAYLLGKSKSILKTLARSKNVWERRIAIISTFQFIKHNQYEISLRIAELLPTCPKLFF